MNSNGKISLTVSILIGVFISLLGISSIFVYSFITSSWSPSSKSANKLLKKRKFDEALALINRVEGSDSNSSVLLEKGKIWMTLAWDRENKTEWRDYGVDRSDWLNSAEADSAEYYLKRAVSLFPQNGEARRLLGVHYMDRGWYSKAESEFIAALKIDNRDYEAYNHMGVLYSREGDYKRAVKEFEKAYSIDSSKLSAVKNSIRIYRDYIKDPENSINWLNRYLNMKTEKNGEYYSMLSSFNELSEKYPEYSPSELSSWRSKEKKFKSRGALKFNP